MAATGPCRAVRQVEVMCLHQIPLILLPSTKTNLIERNKVSKGAAGREIFVWRVKQTRACELLNRLFVQRVCGLVFVHSSTWCSTSEWKIDTDLWRGVQAGRWILRECFLSEYAWHCLSYKDSQPASQGACMLPDSYTPSDLAEL